MLPNITIPGELTSLNQYINAERTNRFRASSIKKKQTELVRWYAKALKSKAQPSVLGNKIFIEIHWYRKDMRSDPDNIAFAKKFILDGLVEEGILENDTWKIIGGFTDRFFLDKQNPRIEIFFRIQSDL